MNARELQKQFPYLTMAKLKSGHGGYKTERGWMKRLEKLNAESEARCTAPFVDHLEVTLTWRDSKTWGLCPRADARWHDEKGYHSQENVAYAGGCGYDKLSSCLSSALNIILTRNLYEARRKMSKKRKEEGKIPYGLEMSDYDVLPYFMTGGCGVSSTMRCVSYIGGKIKHDVGTKVMDRFVIDFKRPKKKA